MIHLKSATVLALLVASIVSRPQEAAVGGIVVEDHTGTPLASVLIRLSRPGVGVLREVETDRDGRFVLGSLAPGEYQLAVTKSNYVPLAVAFSTARPLSPALRLVRHGVISGSVPGAIGGLVVAYEKVPAGRMPRVYRSTLETGGGFRIFGILPGRYVLALLNMNVGTGLQRGQIVEQREFVFTGGEDYAGVVLNAPSRPAASISGRVENPQTHSILLVSPDYPAIQYILMLSRPDGTFRFDNLLPGTYDLIASSMPSAGGTASRHGRVRVNVYDQAKENIVISVRATPPVEFSLDETLCAAEATLTLTPLDRVLGGRPVAVSISAGMPPRVDGLAPSRYQIVTSTREGKCLGTPLSTLDLAQSDAEARVVIRLYPPGAIRGTVADLPRQGVASVVLRDLEPARESADRVQFIEAGEEFVFDNLPPGNYCVAAHMDARSDCAASLFVLGPGESKTVRVSVSRN